MIFLDIQGSKSVNYTFLWIVREFVQLNVMLLMMKLIFSFFYGFFKDEFIANQPYPFLIGQDPLFKT